MRARRRRPAAPLLEHRGVVRTPAAADERA